MNGNLNEEFESLLASCQNALARCVFYRIPGKADAEDVLQDVLLAAYAGFKALKDKSRFKPWILSIARNKCADYFRNRAKCKELPLEESIACEDAYSRLGLTGSDAVSETLSGLGDTEKRMLQFYYLDNMPQAEIARMLGIPLGTVKSRLHSARKSFERQYPYKPKGEIFMKKLPDTLPEVKIQRLNEAPFEAVWEELMGWMVIPRLGEKLSWALYEYPGRNRTETVDLKVIGRASVHGIEGVEITAQLTSLNDTGYTENATRTFVAQLTDTHSRFLCESHETGGVRRLYTFLDEEFLKNWGYGTDNCGNEIHVRQKGLIRREGDAIASEAGSALDIAGRYRVMIGSKAYDTILVMDIETYDSGVMSETYLDQNGRTVLWRRFNRDDWKSGRYGQKWSEKLPDNERLFINGGTYVHWYDCISDYIL